MAIVSDHRGNIAIGVEAMCDGDRCVAIGTGAEAYGKGSMAIGHGVIARDGERKVSIGHYPGARNDADEWYEFFQSIRESLTVPQATEEDKDG